MIIHADSRSQGFGSGGGKTRGLSSLFEKVPDLIERSAEKKEKESKEDK